MRRFLVVLLFPLAGCVAITHQPSASNPPTLSSFEAHMRCYHKDSVALVGGFVGGAAGGALVGLMHQTEPDDYDACMARLGWDVR